MEPDDSMAKRYEKGGDNMAMPKDTIYSEMNKAWEIYLEALENSLDTLEKEMPRRWQGYAPMNGVRQSSM